MTKLDEAGCAWRRRGRRNWPWLSGAAFAQEKEARVRPAVRPHRRRRRPWACCCARATTTTSACVNSKGGVEGYKIRVLEIDNEYKVPPAIEAHERFKKEGAVLTACTARRRPRR